MVAQRKQRISENISVHHEIDEKSSCSGTAGKCVEVNHNTSSLTSQEAKNFGALRTQLHEMMFHGELSDQPSSS